MLIFDMDGTLWNTMEITLESANDISCKYEEVRPFTMEVIEKGMGLNSIENAKNYMPYLSLEKGLDYMNKIIANTVRLINEKGATIYDGVEETLKILSTKYKLGIITNNKDEYVEAFFKATNLEKYFSDYMGAASYDISKAEAIRRMVERNNEPNSYYIGDIKKDMLATEEAGITFIHAKYGFEPSLESKYYIDDIRNLDKLMNEIESK